MPMAMINSIICIRFPSDSDYKICSDYFESCLPDHMQEITLNFNSFYSLITKFVLGSNCLYNYFVWCCLHSFDWLTILLCRTVSLYIYLYQLQSTSCFQAMLLYVNTISVIHVTVFQVLLTIHSNQPGMLCEAVHPLYCTIILIISL